MTKLEDVLLKWTIRKRLQNDELREARKRLEAAAKYAEEADEIARRANRGDLAADFEWCVDGLSETVPREADEMRELLSVLMEVREDFDPVAAVRAALAELEE